VVALLYDGLFIFGLTQLERWIARVLLSWLVGCTLFNKTTRQRSLLNWLHGSGEVLAGWGDSMHHSPAAGAVAWVQRQPQGLHVLLKQPRFWGQCT